MPLSAGIEAESFQFLPECPLGFKKPIDIRSASFNLKMHLRPVRMITKEIDPEQAGYRQNMLELSVIVIGYFPALKGAMVGPFPAFDFHDAFAVPGETVYACAQPLAFGVLQTGGINREAGSRFVASPGFRLQCGASCHRRICFFPFSPASYLEKVIGALPGIFAHDDRRLGRADTLFPPFMPGVCSLLEFDDRIRHEMRIL